MVKCNPLKSTQELVVDASESAICSHLKKKGKVSNLGIQVPHTLREKNKEDCISIVTSFLLMQRNNSFLKYILTEDKNNGCFMTKAVDRHSF